MTYHVCPGIVLATVCGENLLIATREARGKTANVKILNQTGAYFWKCFEQHRELNEIIAQASADYHISVEQVESAIEGFVSTLEKDGYLIPDGEKA